jgi:DNA-directed RNA polymerase-3 subunit RPC5
MSKLFVEEDEEMNGSDSDTSSQFHEALEQPLAEDDDPIIDSIPLVLSLVPQPNQKVHILQYPGRPSTRPLSEGSYKCSMKLQSNYLQVKVPLDTTKFFNETKVEDWGEAIAEQCLDGVMNKTEEGMYVGQVVYDDNDTTKKKVVLVPVDGTGQLRPQFKYVDEVDNLNYAQKKADSDDHKQTNVQILQSAAKPNTQMLNPEGGHNGALGEALKHIKKFEDEQWSGLQWKKTTSDVVQSVKQELTTSADSIELQPTSNLQDYIAKLIQ